MSEIDVKTIKSLEDLGPFLSLQNNAKNTVYFSAIPAICKSEPCILGVDEAGRGPVLGPMVYGISFCPIEKSEVLRDLGCADSKQLTEETRETIFNKLLTEDTPKETIGWAVDVISPNFICNNMLKRAKYSLNEVSMDAAINLIKKAIELEVNIAEVYVDTVGPPEKYEAKLSKIFPDFQITVAKKADSTYPIVSSASICAKVTRDHALKVWKFPEGLELTQENFGSGYPGDPVTKSFLNNNIEPVFGFPRLVRFSWSTAYNLLEADKRAFSVVFDENGEENVSQAKRTPITSFFNKSSNVKNRSRHAFFRNRYLDNVTDF